MVALIIWLALAVVLGAAELMTVTLTLGLIAAAAVAAAVTGAVGLPVPVQILTFVLVSGAGLGLVRPIAKRHLKQPPPLRSGTAALVGRTALVLNETTCSRRSIRGFTRSTNGMMKFIPGSSVLR